MKKSLNLVFGTVVVGIFLTFGGLVGFAETEVFTNTYETSEGMVTYIETSEVVSQEELETIVEENLPSEEKEDFGYSFEPRKRASITVSSFGLVRNGNTTFCELWFNFSGGIVCNAMKFTQIKVQNMNLINKTTYKTFSAATKNFNAGTTKAVYIGAVTIPKGETSAHMVKSGVSIYSTSSGWLSVAAIGNTARIN